MVQALHRIRFEWLASGHSLEIEWARGRAGDQVAAPNFPGLVSCEEEVQPDTVSRLGVPAICWRGDENLFEPLQLREDAEYLVDIVLPLSRSECEAKWQEDPTWPLRPRLRRYYRTEPPKRWASEGGGTRLTGRLSFGSHVGVADLSLPNLPPLVLEVACTKIGYFDDFRSLLDAIADEMTELLLQVDAPTFSRFDYSEFTRRNPLLLLFHLRKILSDDWLPSAVETILRSPQSTVTTERRITPIAAAQHSAPDLVAAEVGQHALRPGGPLASLFNGFTPETLPESLSMETWDTAENRYVKAFLEDLLQETEALRMRLERARKPASVREALNWSTQIGDWLSHPLWRSVGPMRFMPANSQVLQKRQGYREVLTAAVRLELGLSLQWEDGFSPDESVDGDLRPISKLYEYWCFFMLRSALRQVCGPELESRGLVAQRQDGLALVLARGRESRVPFVYSMAGRPAARVTLFYNRSFGAQTARRRWDGSYSAGFSPDYSVLIVVGHGDTARLHWLHFDAKYRLDFNQWQDQLADTTAEIEEDLMAAVGADEGESVRAGATDDAYTRSDLYKMHTYRDALLGSRGSYLMYPGTGQAETVFIRYPGASYGTASHDVPGVGAFQLRPQSAPSQRQGLETFLTTVIAQLAAGRSYNEETGQF